MSFGKRVDQMRILAALNDHFKVISTGLVGKCLYGASLAAHGMTSANPLSKRELLCYKSLTQLFNYSTLSRSLVTSDILESPG